MSTDKNGRLLLPSGGYEKLKSFQSARLIYVRSGVQNIAGGSVDAAASTKLELNLYSVARASLEKLKFDYQDFLRQHCVPVRTKESMLYQEFIRRRISKAAEFKKFINPPFKSVLVANVEHKK